MSNPNARCISTKCTLHLSQQHVANLKMRVAFGKMHVAFWALQRTDNKHLR